MTDRRSRRRLIPTSFAVGLCAAAVAAAGCGSSSKSSSSVTSSASSTPTSSSSSQPLSKAQYERKLGPLLNDVVDPALRATLGVGGAADPQKLGAAITSVRLAHDRMAAITPPAEVADLHQQTVALLAAMISDMTKLRDAETGSDKSGVASAAGALKAEAQHLETLGSQFTSRGY